MRGTRWRGVEYFDRAASVCAHATIRGKATAASNAVDGSGTDAAMNACTLPSASE